MFFRDNYDKTNNNKKKEPESHEIILSNYKTVSFVVLLSLDAYLILLMMMSGPSQPWTSQHVIALLPCIHTSSYNDFFHLKNTPEI